MLINQLPQPAQEAARTSHALVRPLERHLRRRGEHHEQPRGVSAVLLDQRLRIDAIVLGLRHGADAARFNRLAVAFEDRADTATLVVSLDLDLRRIEILNARARRLSKEK